jgi:hypothetical protein
MNDLTNAPALVARQWFAGVFSGLIAVDLGVIDALEQILDVLGVELTCVLLCPVAGATTARGTDRYQSARAGM